MRHLMDQDGGTRPLDHSQIGCCGLACAQYAFSRYYSRIGPEILAQIHPANLAFRVVIHVGVPALFRAISCRSIASGNNSISTGAFEHGCNVSVYPGGIGCEIGIIAGILVEELREVYPSLQVSLSVHGHVQGVLQFLCDGWQLVCPHCNWYPGMRWQLVGRPQSRSQLWWTYKLGVLDLPCLHRLRLILNGICCRIYTQRSSGGSPE